MKHHGQGRRRNTLRSEFTYALFIVLAVTCNVVTVIDCYMVYVRNTRMLARNAEATMEKAVETLGQPLSRKDAAFVQRYADILANDRSLVHLAIYDGQGKALVTQDRDRPKFFKASVAWELDRPVPFNGKAIGRIAMTFTNGDVWTLTRQMIFSDLIIMFSALFAVMGTTWLLLNRRIIEPLGVMERAFHQISDGDYSRRVTLSKNNELSRIADAFNAMVGQVALRDSRLRESETNYRNLVEGTTDIIFRTDLNGCLIYMNQNFAKKTGFRVADFLGRPFFDLVAAGYTEGAFERLKKGEDGESPNLHEIQLVKKDGSLILMELNLTLQEGALDGVPMGTMGIARDITWRKRTQEDLKKYEQMVAASSDCLWLTDQSLTLQAVNEAYLGACGRERSALIGRPVADVVGADLFEAHVKPYLQGSLKGKSMRHRDWVRFPARGLKFIDFTFSPSFDAENKVNGVVVNERDFTNQKTLETRLQQSRKMESIGTLAGGIAHDFNNILGAIIGYAEMIEMFDVDNDERLALRIGHILKGAYRARELVEQILTFSRHGEQEKRVIRLSPVLQESLKFLRASIPSTIVINEAIDCPDDAVLANATQIHQVLMNLCTNAAYAMSDAGGTLSVRLDDANVGIDQARQLSGILPGPHARLTVTDTGPGISPEVIGRVFDPFFTTKKTGDGTGMGLAVVHGIVKACNGTVTVQSVPGEGTTFCVLLPAADKERTEAQETTPVVVAGGRGKILFVDDEEELVSFSSEILRHLGYDVVAETSSLGALRLFFDDPEGFDLVITDQTMPEMTGHELARKVLARRPDLPVVLCTGFSSSKLEEEALGAGIRSFMKKPIGARQLADIVSQMMHRPQAGVCDRV